MKEKWKSTKLSNCITLLIVFFKVKGKKNIFTDQREGCILNSTFRPPTPEVS